MKAKNLLILAVLAVVLIGLAVKTQKKRLPPAPDEIGRLILKDLPLNDIERIRVQSPSGGSLVVRKEDRWVVPGRFDYPADFDALKRVVMKLSELKVGQVVHLDDRQRRTLKLAPPPSPGGTGTPDSGTQVTLENSKGDVIASLLVGAPRLRQGEDAGGFGGGYPDGTYVSPDGGQTVYLTSEVLDDLPAEDNAWLAKELLNVQAAEVARVEITGPDRAAVRLSRSKETNELVLEDLAENEKMDNSKLYAVESALAYLRIEDVADPALSDEQLGMVDPAVFVLETRNGELYTARVGAKDASEDGGGKRYVRFSAALREEPPAPSETPEAGKEVGADEARKKARAELAKKVDDLNRRLSGWTYQVSTYKTDGMLTKREDLLKAEEDTTAEAAAETEEPSAETATAEAIVSAEQEAEPKTAAETDTETDTEAETGEKTE